MQGAESAARLLSRFISMAWSTVLRTSYWQTPRGERVGKMVMKGRAHRPGSPALRQLPGSRPCCAQRKLLPAAAVLHWAPLSCSALLATAFQQRYSQALHHDLSKDGQCSGYDGDCQLHQVCKNLKGIRSLRSSIVNSDLRGNLRGAGGSAFLFQGEAMLHELWCSNAL